VRGGFLVQDRFRYSGVADESKWKVATTAAYRCAMERSTIAWAAVGSIKSNAIVLVRDEAAIGIGAGQMSRVDSSFLAVHKARQQGHDPGVRCSPAMPSSPSGTGDEAAAAGVAAIIQPGVRQRRRGHCGGRRTRSCYDPDRYAAVPSLDYWAYDEHLTNRTAPADRRPVVVSTAPLSAAKPPYLMAACVSLGALILYVSRSRRRRSSGIRRYIAAAYTLGIPHPPGNPLFVLMAHVWDCCRSPTPMRSASICSPAYERDLGGVLVPRHRALAPLVRAGAVAAPVDGARRRDRLRHRVHGVESVGRQREGVHASLLSIALILWLIVRWDDQPAGEAHDHHLLLIIYLLASPRRTT